MTIPIITDCDCDDCNKDINIVSVAGIKFMDIAPVNGKANDVMRVIKFSVLVSLSNGTVERREYSFEIKNNNNNPDGKHTFDAGHDLEGYGISYDIKGNGSNVKTFTINKNK